MSVTIETPTGTRNWTPAQQLAIETTGKSLLVSAAAGSGKTSVLAERCVHLLCDAQPPCEVAELLVVTFTEAAAAEMKSRITKSLLARHADSPGGSTSRHLAMLDRATISTLHGFCARVLRQNFHLMGLDPEFQILDEDEAALLRIDIAGDMFDQRYDDPEDENFRQLVDCYADGQDDRLITQVIRAYSTLCSVVDPVGWLTEARHRIEDAINLPMDKSELGKTYLATVRAELQSLMAECKSAGEAIKQLRNFPMYVEHLRELWTTLSHWLQVLNSHGIDGLADVAGTVEFPRMTAVPNSTEGKAIAKAHLDRVRESMKGGAWRKNLLFTSDEWKEGLRLTLPHVEVFLSLVADFSHRYTEAKSEVGSLDFADLEQLTLRSLKQEGVLPPTPSPLARTFHHQFRHVLVDEYQDINEVQDAILSLVSRECLDGNTDLESNLFCVGDVKQSIYRFRLAEAKRFLDRRDLYSEPNARGQVIDLQTNFRSRAPLLEVINSLFERLMTKAAADLDYDKSQRLTPGAEFPQLTDGFSGSPVELHLLPRDQTVVAENENDELTLDRTQREAVVLGQRVLEMVGRAGKPPMQIVDRSGGEVTSRPIRFSDIVLLLRSVRYKADQFAATLREMGIPVHTESATGYFQATEVNDVLSLLHVLDNQRQDIPLAALLRSPLANLENAESNLARVRVAYAGEPPVPFHLAVQKYATEQQDSLAEFLRQFRGKLERWRQNIRQRPVAEMLWSIYNETGYLAYVTGLSNGHQREANLIELHDRARQFGTFHRQGLSRFLTFLERLKESSDLGQAPIASDADDVIRILSIHKSKGREFPVVLLPDLGKAFNLQDSQGSILLDRSAGIGFAVVDPKLQVRYPSLASTIVQKRIKQQAMAEELRVLYVAMTRAKEHLILVATCADTQVEKWQDRWANHKGALPASEVLEARTTLDWLGPLAAILPNQIQLHTHTWEEIGAWNLDHSAANQLSPAQNELAQLQPIAPAPPPSPEAESVIARMSLRYPFGAVADQAAAASVTSLVKAPVRIPAYDSVDTFPSFTDRDLPRPEFLVGRSLATAADIGTATHAVLEHFDFSLGIDIHAIERQIAAMVESRRIHRDLVSAIDKDAIAWFLSTDVGQLIQRNAKGIHRELPVYYVNPSDTTETDDVFDRPMIRGRIDLLVPTADGWMIVDYKTDRVLGPDLDRRTELYTGQLAEYRKAIGRITGKPVTECALIFLHPREIRRF